MNIRSMILTISSTAWTAGVQVILTCGRCGIEPTTVIDLTGPVPELIRQGTGDVVRLGIQ